MRNKRKFSRIEERKKIVFESILRVKEEESQAFHQRAHFVWGFLMVCLAAYAVLAHDILLGKDISANRITIVNYVMLALAVIMVRLSIYWIQMNKGASAWAENYDYIAENFLHRHLRINRAVSDQQDIRCIGRDDIAKKGPGSHFDEIFGKKNCDLCNGNPTYACIFSVLEPSCPYSPELDTNIFTVKAGAYSPRKISILISRLALWISLILLAVNLAVAIFSAKNVEAVLLKSWFSYVTIGVCVMAVVFMSCGKVQSWIRTIGGWLENFGTEDQSMTLIQVQKICDTCRKGK